MAVPPPSGPARVVAGPPPGRTRARRAQQRPRTRAAVRRRRLGCATSLLVFAALVAGLGTALVSGIRGFGGVGPAIRSGPEEITGIPAAEPVPWRGEQPTYGVDISFPQCGRVLRDMPDGYAIVGLDGGMPDRPNPCFAAQWRYALRQSGAAVYVNTADDGRGDPARVGRRAAREDLAALEEQGVAPGTPIWLDVELPEVWRGSQARHRAVIAEHLRVLAEAGHPVGVYSAPALWREITGDADLDVPIWVGIGRATAQRARATCGRANFGGRAPAMVQRIGTGTDGRPLDRNTTCPGTDLTGLVRPG